MVFLLSFQNREKNINFDIIDQKKWRLNTVMNSNLPFTKTDIYFYSGHENERCSGWFYKLQTSDQLPCIILGHGFSGTKQMQLGAFAEKFVHSGYHALVFDYRHFGESEGHPRQLLNIKKQHEDWHSAIQFAKTLDSVDHTKIILWGSSFSGGHVIEIGALHPDIAAVISQVPYTNCIESAMATGFFQNFRLFIASLRDMIHYLFNWNPFYVRVLGEPGELAAITAPGEYVNAQKMIPDGYEYDNRVCARIFLSMPFYNPGLKAKHLMMPLLVQIANFDSTIPGNYARKAAKQAKNAQILTYDYSHFELYNDPAFSIVVDDQIKFLKNSI